MLVKKLLFTGIISLCLTNISLSQVVPNLERNINKQITGTYNFEFKGFDIEFIAEKQNPSDRLKTSIKEDTLIVSSFEAESLKSLRLINIPLSKYQVLQFCKYGLIAVFDGKALQLPGKQDLVFSSFLNLEEIKLKSCSEQEASTILLYSQSQIRQAIKENKTTLGEKLYLFMMENLKKPNPEVYFETMSVETILKLQVEEHESFYIKFYNLLGC